MTHLRPLHGGLGSDSDPRQAGPQSWNREWVQGEHGGITFTTDAARVDVVNPKPRTGARIFIGGSRTISDRAAVTGRIDRLPSNALVLTSRTWGTSAAVRDAVRKRGLQMEVWTARLDRYPTKEASYFARDEEMIRSADRVIAFWDGCSSGTAYELDFARQIGKPVELVIAFEGQPPSAREPHQGRRTLLVSQRFGRGPQTPDRYPGGDAA
jgi:hypothetical protein